MTPIYQWYLTANSVSGLAYPVYKGDLALNWERETDEQFFRKQFSSNIVFVGYDASRIIYAPFTDKFEVELMQSTDGGTSWELIFKSKFYKTDCTINEDELTVKVKPQPDDVYNDVLNGLEKEFNLIELKPVIQPLNAYKAPMFQIYTAGEDTITCISGGNSFEVDVVDGSGDRAVACHFKRFGNTTTFIIEIEETSVQGFSTPFTGTFSGAGSTFSNPDGLYYISYFERTESPESGRGYICYNGFRIYEVGGQEVKWSFSQYQIAVAIDDYKEIPTEFTFQPQVEGLDQLHASKYEYGVYGRMVTDLEQITIGGETIDTEQIPTNDIVANNRNYRYCIGFDEFALTISTRTSQNPTEWGRTPSDDYYNTPDDVRQWFPVGRSQWGQSSVWLDYDSTFMTWEADGTKPYVIKDTYPLWSVIKVLLAEVAPSVSHNNNSSYSQFLYGSQSSFIPDGIFIAPKSNIILGEYQEPAQKAPITLKDVLDMLKKCYACYWYIDSNNRFRIEHISYFKNGGSYSGAPSVDVDLRSLTVSRNGKAWSFCTSEYSYDKEDMPERYQFEWMDKSTLLFKGHPINVLSPYVQGGKIEEVNIANFTSDINYMLIAPEECSKDGFALLGADIINSEYTVAYTSMVIGVNTYHLQNHKCSMWYLQQFFLTYNMPAWSIEVNETVTTADGIQRNKKQQVDIPYNDDLPDTLKLVRTNIGNGEYDSISLNLSSRMAKVTLKYNTY